MALETNTLGNQATEAQTIEQLKEEVQKLQASLADAKAQTGTRAPSGLLKPSVFEERGNEEYARSRRYKSPLTLVVVTIMGFDKITHEKGREACDHYVKSLADKCVKACREGADILGQIKSDQFAILLPEADITGCTRFKERLKNELVSSKIEWNGEPLKSGMKISAGVLLAHDTSYDELLERTIGQKTVLDRQAA